MEDAPEYDPSVTLTAGQYPRLSAQDEADPGACWAPLLAFASAAFFGLNNATTRRGVLKGSVLQGMAITVPLGVPIFVAFALAMGGFSAMADWGVASWVWMILAGIVHFVIGRYGNYKATQALGATLSTPVQQLSILIALVLAFVFLGETINTVNLIGIALIIIGPMILVRRRKARCRPRAPPRGSSRTMRRDCSGVRSVRSATAPARC